MNQVIRRIVRTVLAGSVTLAGLLSLASSTAHAQAEPKQPSSPRTSAHSAELTHEEPLTNVTNPVMDVSSPTVTAVVPNPGFWVVGNQGLSGLIVEFSEPVVVPTGAVRAWTVLGQDLTGLTAAFEPVNNRLVIVFPIAVREDIVTIALDSTIHDEMGNVLDGEITSPASPALPSGDGEAGGIAVIRIRVLQGDADRSGLVDEADGQLVAANLGRSAGQPNFDPRADLNGDGFVNVLDVGIYGTAIGRSLPATDGAAPALSQVTPDPMGGFLSPLDAVTLRFTEPIAASRFIGPTTLEAFGQEGDRFVATEAALSPDGLEAMYVFDPPLPICDRFRLKASNSLADLSGELLVPPAAAPVLDGIKPPPAPQLDEHETMLASADITISGDAPYAAMVEVSGPAGQVQAQVGPDGRFSIQPLLSVNRANQLFFSSISACGVRGPAVATSITVDAQAPNLFIDFPAAGAQIQASTTDVAGRVADTLSGFMGLSVSVNGQSAQVNVGIGTNGTFVLPGLILAEAGTPTTITAVATDLLGNTTTREITVTRYEIPAGSPRMELVSGNGQHGVVSTLLSEPIVVRMLRGDGSPFAGKLVTFTATRSDGRLKDEPSAESAGAMMFQTFTDSQGYARAYWTLGGDAGMGNNRVSVTSRDIAGTVAFCASAAPGTPKQLNIGSGNNQKGEAGAPLGAPLVAWVSDSCNGGADVPVTFTVTRGGGAVNGQESVTVLTGATGHASVQFTLGPDAGNQEVVADFSGNLSSPATFTAYALVRDPAKPTSFSGLVFDNASQPIGGAHCWIIINGQQFGETYSNEQGQFRFDNLPDAGDTDLWIDGLSATTLGGMPISPGSFPGLHFEITTIPNAANSLAMPVLLPRLNPVNARQYSTTKDTILTVEGMDGLKMKIKAGSMRLPNGQAAPDGTIVALNQVHHDDVPMPMPDGAAPPFAWTLQPGGAHFDPPIQIEYPNMSALPPGGIANFLSFDHETSRFEIVSSGHVTADGSTIVSDPGGGLSISGWGCNCPPYSVTGKCCFDESFDPEASPCLQCTETGLQNLPDGIPCDDGDPCTINDRCRNGVCKGEPVGSPCLSSSFVEPIPAGDWARGRTGSSRNATWATDVKIEWEPCFDESRRAWFAHVTAIKIDGQIEWSISALPAVGACSHGQPTLQEAVGAINSSNYCEIINDLSMERSALAECWHSQQALAVHESFHRDEDIPRILWPRANTALSEIELVSVPCSGAVTPTTAAAELGRRVEVIRKNMILGFGRDFRDFANCHNQASGRTGCNGAYEASMAILDPIIASARQFQVNFGLPLCAPRPFSEPMRVDPIFVELTVEPQTLRLDPGQEVALVALAHFSDGSVVDVSQDPNIQYSTASPEIATVDAIGRVVAVAPGTAHISVTYFCTTVRCLPGQASVFATVLEPNDSDADGLPDQYEEANGLDPHDPADAILDEDHDDLSNVVEFMIGTDPWNPDTDGDNIPDGVEVQQGMDPLSFPGLDAAWTTSVGSQSVLVDAAGIFQVRNISSADNFGPGGPGTPPDFFSDDFLRVSGTAVINGQTFYAESSPFQIRQGQTYLVPEVLISDRPPPQPQSLRITAPQIVLEPGQTSQFIVTGALADGSQVDVTPRAAFTTYRTSNPAVATVGPDGLVSAVSPGIAFIVAVNDAAAAVRVVTVTPQATTTTVTGFALLPGGAPAVGASVTTQPFGGSATTDASGFFAIPITVTAEASALTVRATLNDAGQTLVGVAHNVPILIGVFTDAGAISLAPAGTGPLFLGELFAVGSGPYSVAIGDLSGDGVPDLAVANSDSSSVSVLLGVGNGTFPAEGRRDFAVGSGPVSVAIGDLDGDGVSDLAVANSGSGTVSVLVGAGNGSFAPRVNFAVGSSPRSVAIRDLNDDGFPDLTVANESSNTVSVLLGAGNGSFAPQVAFAVGSSPYSVAIGDLSGDGVPDLAVANQRSASVSVLLGTGNGSFAPRVNFAVGSFPNSVTIGDLNDDGVPDLAVANESSNTVSVLLGAGNGSFVPQVAFAVGTSPQSVAIGDLNDDGVPDLAVTNRVSGSVSVLLGAGNGSFAPRANFGVGSNPRSVAIRDLNGDGFPDLAVANSGSSSVSVLLGAGNGSFATRQDFAVEVGPRSVTIGDLNDDGVPDLAVANTGVSSVSVLIGAGNGSFAPRVNFAGLSGPSSVAIGDLNGDGVPDLAVANAGSASNSVSVLLGTGNGSFAPRVNFAVGSSPYSVAIGDLSGDGVPDLAVANSGSSSVSVLLGVGNGTFPVEGRRDFAVGSFPRSVAIGDLDGDGVPDLAVANSGSSSVSVLLGVGNGTFPVEGRRDFAVGTSPFSVAIGDLSGDGFPDLAVANSGSSSVSVLLNQRTGGTPRGAPLNPALATAIKAQTDRRGSHLFASPEVAFFTSAECLSIANSDLTARLASGIAASIQSADLRRTNTSSEGDPNANESASAPEDSFVPGNEMWRLRIEDLGPVELATAAISDVNAEHHPDGAADSEARRPVTEESTPAPLPAAILRTPAGVYLPVSMLLPENSPWSIVSVSAADDAGRIEAIALYRGVRRAVRLTIVPMTAPCCDVDNDGVIGQSDVLMILSKWGSTNSPEADINLDGFVDLQDIQSTLEAWATEAPRAPSADAAPTEEAEPAALNPRR